MTDELHDEAMDRFARWFREARALDVPEPTACVLATADASARPSARTVLLKSFDSRGFVFFSNAGSIKGRQMEENPRAALCFYWHTPPRQVHIEGAVEVIAEEETDAYWNTRSRSSRVGALASAQSRPIASREELMRRFEEYAKQYADGDVPRPDWWVGYRVIPDMIEFWAGREHRLHERVRYNRSKDGWEKRLLNP